MTDHRRHKARPNRVPEIRKIAQLGASLTVKHVDAAEWLTKVSRERALTADEHRGFCELVRRGLIAPLALATAIRLLDEEDERRAATRTEKRRAVFEDFQRTRSAHPEWTLTKVAQAVAKRHESERDGEAMSPEAVLAAVRREQSKMTRDTPALS